MASQLQLVSDLLDLRACCNYQWLIGLLRPVSGACPPPDEVETDGRLRINIHRVADAQRCH